MVKLGMLQLFLHFFSIFSLFEPFCVLISIGAHQEILLLAHFCVHGKTDNPKSNTYVLRYLNKIHVSIVWLRKDPFHCLFTLVAGFIIPCQNAKPMAETFHIGVARWFEEYRCWRLCLWEAKSPLSSTRENSGDWCLERYPISEQP